MYIMTENAKTHQNAYFEMALKQEHIFIHTFPSMHSVCQEAIFSVANNGEGGGGGILNYVPFWAQRATWLDQTGTLHI